MDARKRKTKGRAKEADVQCAHAQTTRRSTHEPFSLERILRHTSRLTFLNMRLGKT